MSDLYTMIYNRFKNLVRNKEVFSLDLFFERIFLFVYKIFIDKDYNNLII